MPKHFLSFLLLTLLCLNAFAQHPFPSDSSRFASLRPADLLFFSDDSGLGAAVQESTGRYSHVAIVERVGDTVWIIDATPSLGVARRPLFEALSPEEPLPDVFRLVVPFDTLSLFVRASARLGLPYDETFLPYNGAIYCSELVYECYLNLEGHPLFSLQPMNWRNSAGKIPTYWKQHFRRLRMPVPEGVLGSNPTDLSRSPLLKKL